MGCSDVSLLSWTKSTQCDIWVQTQFDGNKYHENKSYCEANKICANAGGRLCTKAELEAKCTIGTGCEFDNDLIWSQTEGILVGSPSTPAFALIVVAVHASRPLHSICWQAQKCCLVEESS